MSTFWKIFGVFWIIFFIWYLTGGPQRVNVNENNPIRSFDVINNKEDKTNLDNQSTVDTSLEESSQDQKDEKEKSFSSFPKANTIKLDY